METKKTSFGNIKEMLTRDQMKKIKGGTGYQCCATSGGPYSGCSACNGSAGSDWTCHSGSVLTAC